MPQLVDRRTITTTVTAIRAALEQSRRAIFSEIRSYPTPIAGCDVQFNRLIEQRAAIVREIGRLEAIAADGTHPANKLGPLADLIRSSAFIDAAAKPAMLAMLDKTASPAVAAE